MVSLGVKLGLIEPVGYHQLECFEAAQRLPVPRAHPAAETSRSVQPSRAIRCREETRRNASSSFPVSHGLTWIHDRFFCGHLEVTPTRRKIEAAIAELPTL
jgi:hypothetical protein